MRHETCLACRVTPVPAVVLAEKLSPDTHHHHAVACEDCGTWWFDDVVMSAYGIPVASRRGTELCECPEDREVFSPTVILVPAAEAGCRCEAAELDRRRVNIRLGDSR